jgi:hypothetical protein
MHDAANCHARGTVPACRRCSEACYNRDRTDIRPPVAHRGLQVTQCDHQDTIATSGFASKAAHLGKYAIYNCVRDETNAKRFRVVRRPSALDQVATSGGVRPICSRERLAGARRRRTIRRAPSRNPWPRGSCDTPRRSGHRRRRRGRADAPSRSRRWSRW